MFPSFRQEEKRGEVVVAGLSLAALALALFSPGMLNDPDTWWHLVVGEWVLDHAQAPRTDLWSYTMAGAPWTAHEWLSEALIALAYRAAGWSGVVAQSALAFGLTAWIIGRRLSRKLSGAGLAVLLVMGLSLVTPSLLARPHLLALPILAGWTAALLAARDRDRAPSLWLLPLMTLWANLHGGYAFGLALIGPFALEALVSAAPSRRLSVVRDWGLFGLGALVAALITPYGADGLMLPFQLLSMKALAGIGEWQPANFSHLEPLEVALLALLTLAVLRRPRFGPVRLALLLGLIHLSLSQSRHGMLLGVVGAMLVADALARPEEGDMPVPATARGSRAAVLGVALAAMALIGVRLAWPITRTDSVAAPMAALDIVPGAVRATPVLNDYAFGGYLIRRGVRPFVDSRAELYGDKFLFRYNAIIGPDPQALDAALADYGIGWTIFAPSQPVVALLDARPGWRRLYADRYAVVHVRTAPRP
jgi:hypothetical protein